eukprot:14668926-Alexandrium_andersonii.AAC.1
MLPAVCAPRATLLAQALVLLRLLFFSLRASFCSRHIGVARWHHHHEFSPSYGGRLIDSAGRRDPGGGHSS